MLVTLPMARCAMPVRSGSAAGAAGAAARVCAAAWRLGGRRRRRHLGAAHAAGEHESGHQADGDRGEDDEEAPEHGHESCAGQRTSILRGGGGGTFGTVTVSTPSLRSAVIRSPSIESVNSNTRAERAVTALDLVIVHRVAGTGPRLAAALDHEPRLLDGELDVLTAEAGHLGGHDEARRPSRRRRSAAPSRRPGAVRAAPAAAARRGGHPGDRRASARIVPRATCNECQVQRAGTC